MKNMIRQAVVAALYTVLTLAFPALSYGPIQFRIAEVLNLLAFFNPTYVIGVTLGCGIANIFSTVGMIDVVVGTLGTLLATFLMTKIKNIWVSSLMPTLFSIVVGIEISIMSGTWGNFIPITLQIMLSQFIIVTVIGVPLFKSMMKNQTMKRLICERD